MATPIGDVHQRAVYRLAAQHISPNVTDRELLDRFTTRQDEAAYAALVHRHGGLVFAAAQRVLGNGHDAEDVCQATFLLLAKSAASRRWQPSVASWLHKTAHNLALKARRSAVRRARREGQVAGPQSADPLDELTGRELLAVLDEELLALPESLRAPLVLCYLQGATRDEAADRLGCPLSTLKKRLERGRARLHAALTRRGVGPAAALVGTLATRDGSAAMGPDLTRQTVQAALAIATGHPLDGILSARVLQIIRGEFAMIGWNKVRTTLAVVLVGGLLSVAAFTAGEDKPPPPEAPAASQPPPPAPPAVPAVEGTMAVIVVDTQGKPIPGAIVRANITPGEEEFNTNRKYRTDSAGIARVELPKTYNTVRLWVKKPKYVPLFANWEEEELRERCPLPAQYTFRLEPGSTASGRIVDEQGKPVAGARVEVSFSELELRPPGGDGRTRYSNWLADEEDTAITDNDGRWRIDTAPKGPKVEFRLKVRHPEFCEEPARRGGQTEPVIPDAVARSGTAVWCLHRICDLRGRVTDMKGVPINAATVIQGDSSPFIQRQYGILTDADGKFTIADRHQVHVPITIIAPGQAPLYRRVEVRSGQPVQDFRMGPGKPLRLRIVGPTGKPVDRVAVAVTHWKGSPSIDSRRDAEDQKKLPNIGIPSRTGPDGTWVWSSAPDEPVTLRVAAEGYAPLQFDLAAGLAERTITLKPEHRITGAVIDAATGKPIPYFVVSLVDGVRTDGDGRVRRDAKEGKNGQLGYLVARNESSWVPIPLDTNLRLLVEAPGYRPQWGPEFRIGDDSPRTLDFRLRRSRARIGVVVGIDGEPVELCEVRLATPTEAALLANDGSAERESRTDVAGRFAFYDPGEPWGVIAKNDDGVAFAEFPADRIDAGTLKLQPWGSVRGTLRDGGLPVNGATIRLQRIELTSPTRARFNTTLETTTNPDGSFVFPRVAPGPMAVSVVPETWLIHGPRARPSIPCDVKPGGQIKLDLGSGGATVTGRVKLTGTLPPGLDLSNASCSLVRREPGIAPPLEIARLGFDARKGWQETWTQTPEGRAFLMTLPSWSVKLAPDGSFQVSGVSAGEYDLALSVFAKAGERQGNAVARRVVRVTVTAADAARGTLAVTEIAVEVGSGRGPS